jgi:uncharacterized protein
MSLEWYEYLLLLLGGAVAGVVNTLAGNGSTITLFLLMTFGLPATVANGTNRIGILFQSLIAVNAYRKSDRFLPVMREHWWIIALAVPSGIVGALTAANLNQAILEKIIGGLMIVLLLVILVNPQRWLRETDTDKNRKTLLNALLFVALGFYAGFIQLGMGLFFLAILVLGAKFSLKDANLLKIVVVFAVTAPALVIYLLSGQVNWEYGLPLAAGQGIGAAIAARFLIHHPKASVWVYRLLVVMVLVAIFKLLS